MEISVETDLEEDLPEEDRPETEEETITYLMMLKGTVEDSIDDLFDPELRVIASNEVGERTRKFSLNDPKWCVLCHNCNTIVAKELNAHEAFHEFQEHLDDGSVKCYKHDYAIDRKLSRLKEIRNAIEEARD